MSFWDAIEEHIAALDGKDGADAADPWAGADVGEAGLTEEQVAFLAGLDDQPPVPRLEGEDMG